MHNKKNQKMGGKRAQMEWSKPSKLNTVNSLWLSSTYKVPNSSWYFAAASFHLILNVGVKVSFSIKNSPFET